MLKANSYRSIYNVPGDRKVNPYFKLLIILKKLYLGNEL